MKHVGKELLKHCKRSAVRYVESNAVYFDTPLTFQLNRGRFECARKGEVPLSDTALEDILKGEVLIRAVYAPLVHEVLRYHEPNYEQISTFTLILTSAGDLGRSSSEHRSPLYIAEMIAWLTKLRWAERGFDHFHVKCVHIKTDPHKITPSQLLGLEEAVLACASPVADQEGEHWRDHFQLFLSLNTGTTVMISAIALTFTEWKPTFLNISKARQEALQSTPEVPTNEYKATSHEMSSINQWIQVTEEELNEAARMAVSELRVWRHEYLIKRPIRPKELWDLDEDAVFFHRKGFKEVLCVVVVRNPNGDLVPVRGANIEVSLPTGTLCAERNAIGTAFCQNPNLRRRDIKAVAVLSLSPKLSKLGPCGACEEWLKKVTEVSPELRILGFNNPSAEEIFLRPALLT
jgi:cytidine deaminase